MSMFEKLGGHFHRRETCAGQHCAIHNPSDHHMNTWPRVWRGERQLLERTCPHGVGHPDPDHLAYVTRTRGAGEAVAHGVHGCDGCCTPPAPGVFQHEGPPAEGKKASNPKDIIGAGKAPLELVPDTLRVAASMAFLEGALKYGRYNWRLAGVRASIYKAALDRHMTSWWNGEDVDEVSGLPHLWKAAACIAILIDAKECLKLTDDRPPRAPLTEMIERMEAEVARLKALHADKSPHQCTIADGMEPKQRQVAGRAFEWVTETLPAAPGCGSE